MADLEWHQFYEIGVEFIDEEHKAILSIMRGIQESVVRCDFDKTYSLTNRLVEVVQLHFTHEEEFLEKIEYPDLLEHNNYHKELLEQAALIKKICQGIDSEHDLLVCFDEMKKFMVDDILYGDIKFKSFLEYKGLIPG